MLKCGERGLARAGGGAASVAAMADAFDWRNPRLAYRK
jgi:hypothetical protein